ncbi:YdcF family protein [Neisseria sp. CCUG12390]|uniref:YdcF family protein n=1 Tax=Neisseria sp. CCUG12390 TaxID=3392035 RepID=UPI003A0FDB1A
MKMFKMIFYLLILAALTFLAAVYAVYRSEQNAVHQSERHPPEKADVALVLGNTVNRRGKPNPCLMSRVEAGVWLYRAGKADYLLMSGGTDSDGSNQAETMRDMAVRLGVPSENILVENRSETTFQNIRFSPPLLKDRRDVIIVSDGFHLPRGLWLARKRWPDKNLQTFVGRSCGDSQAVMWRKRVREVLAWVKALVLDKS